MLSPPSRMWSPTATRASSSDPPRSTAAIAEKSVVPPPTSTTRMTSPGFTWRRQPSPIASIHAYSAACGSSSSVTRSRPAASAASTVSSRAPASNDAGTVMITSCARASRSPRLARRARPTLPPDARGTATTPRPARSSPHPRVPRAAEALRADRIPPCDSQLFALEMTRAGASTPRVRAYSPTAYARFPSHGSAMAPSLACAKYRNEGSSARSSTAACDTSCAVGMTSVRAFSTLASANARAQCVVPRSIPTT